MLLLAAAAEAYVPPELVCDTCAYPTLGDAADSVLLGEERHFEVLAGTYVEPDGVRILEGRTVTFTAVGGVTVSRQLPVLGPVFDVVGTALAPAVLELTGVSVTAIGERAVRATYGDVTLADCVLFTIGIVEEGGVVFVDRSTLRVDGSLFLESTATTQGGHLLARDTALTVIDTEFRGGFARYGGSVALQSLDLVDDVASIEGGRFEDNLAAEAGGAIVVSGGVALTIDGATFEHNTAPNGGALSDDPQGLVNFAPTITIAGSTFEDNAADEGGGAIANTVAVTTVTDTTFRANTAASGGAVWISGGSVDLAGSLLCENEAAQGGAVMSLTASAQAWNNTRFVENEATIDGGAVSHHGGLLVLEHGNLLGNVAPTGGALLTSAALELRSSLFAYTGPARAVDTAGTYASVHLAANAWWQNAGGDVRGYPDAIEGEVQDEDPRLVRYVPGLGCDAVNDYFSWYGPLRDAAAAGELDLDGTAADIGAYGGPGAAAEPWLDIDQDGFPALYDCLEGDPAFHPEDGVGPPVEVWYDDLDQDCRGDDDHDQDADGWQPPGDCDDTDARINPGARDLPDQDLDCEPGVDGDGDGYPPPADCDDADPDINPGEIEDPDPRIDRDCSAPADVVRGLVPAPCSTAPGAAGTPVLLVSLLALRRRRPRA